MKKIIIILLLSVIVQTVHAQDQGVKFVSGLSWGAIIAKAKQEHKYIFIDCYATWCVPCKQMEAEVYPQKEVGDYYNAHFINVKLQMDKTSHDADAVKDFYGLASSLEQHYAIDAYPTFLFLSPEENALHKVSGTRSVEKFIQIGKDAQDSTKQYYTLVKNFQPGKLDTSELKPLARLFRPSDPILAGKMALDYLTRIDQYKIASEDNYKLIQQFQDNPQIVDIAIRQINANRAAHLDWMSHLGKQAKVQAIAVDYISHLSKKVVREEKNLQFISQFKKDKAVKALALNYIDHLPKQELYTRKNILFTTAFADTSSGRGYDLFFHDGVKADTILHQAGYSKAIINAIIKKELVAPAITAAKKTKITPDWEAMTNAIEKKFGKDYVASIVLNAKVGWYYDQKDWPNFTKYLVEKTEMNGFEEHPANIFGYTMALNNNAWAIFQHSDSREELEKALGWMDRAIRLDSSTGHPDGGDLDTKANILYKLGRKEEALQLEKQAVELSPKAVDIKQTYAKMQTGEPTWNNSNQ